MSPRTKIQFDEIRQKSRTKIKETALELFGKHGYHSTSISKISKEAGVSKGLMYNYFASKEALLKEIILEHTAENIAQWNTVLEKDLSALEKLKEFTQKTAAQIQGNRHHWQLFTALAFQPEARAMVAEEVMNTHTIMFEQTVALFEEAGAKDATKETLLYGAFLDGMFLHYISTESDYPMNEMITFFFNKYTS